MTQDKKIMRKPIEELLWHARQTGTIVERDALSKSLDSEKAYQLQQAQIHLSQQTLIGWKLGATSKEAQNILGLDEPFFGPLPQNQVFASPATVPVFSAQNPMIEAEFAILLEKDLPPQPVPYTRAEIAEAVRHVLPAFEIVATRIAGGFKYIGARIIADGGANFATILGSPETNISAPDFRNLVVSVHANNELKAQGSVKSLLWEDLHDAIIWLSAKLADFDMDIKSGDIIMTGACAGMLPICPDDTVTAHFGKWGAVEANITQSS